MDAELVNPLGAKTFDLGWKNIVKAGGFFVLLGAGGALAKSVMNESESTVDSAFDQLDSFSG